jgi:hypothetical protein
MSEVFKTEPVLLNTELTVTITKRNVKFKMDSYQELPSGGP